MRMDTDKELRSAGAGPQPDSSNLVNAEVQPSDVTLGTGSGLSTSLFRSSAPAFSNLGTYYHVYPHAHQYQNRDNVDHRDRTAQNLNHQSQHYLHSESLTMSDAWTWSTLSGSSSFSEAHASGLGAPPTGTTKSSHRNPFQQSRSHPNLISSSTQHTSPDNQLKKPGGGQPFSPPFLHPLSLRTSSKSSRTLSPHPAASAKRYRDGRKSRTRFTIGSSRPNSPFELEPKRDSSPTRPAPPFTIRGFLALPTLSKVVAILFACCVYLLFRAFLGIGHSAEGCVVYAHEVTNPGPGSTDDPKFPMKDRIPADRRGGDDEARVLLEMVEEMYGYQYDWKFEEYEVGHDGGDDRYDDEYEHEDFLDPA